MIKYATLCFARISNYALLNTGQERLRNSANRVDHRFPDAQIRGRLARTAWTTHRASSNALPGFLSCSHKDVTEQHHHLRIPAADQLRSHRFDRSPGGTRLRPGLRFTNAAARSPTERDVSLTRHFLSPPLFYIFAIAGGEERRSTT